MVIPHAPLIWIFTLAGLWQAAKWRLGVSESTKFAAVGLLSTAAGFAIGDQAKPGRCQWGLSPLQIEWFGSAAMAVGLAATAMFFLSAAHGLRSAVRLARVLAVAVVSALAGMAAPALVSSCSTKVFTPSSGQSLWFLSLEKLYVVPVWSALLVTVVLYGRALEARWPRRGMVVCANGTAANLLAQVIYTFELAWYWRSSAPPAWLVHSGRWLNYTGQLAFLVGLASYALVVHIRTARFAIEAARDVRRLRPLYLRVVAARASQVAGENRMPGTWCWIFAPFTTPVEQRYRMIVALRDWHTAVSTFECSDDDTSAIVGDGGTSFDAELRFWRRYATLYDGGAMMVRVGGSDNLPGVPPTER
jgi:hypothetical protein